MYNFWPRAFALLNEFDGTFAQKVALGQKVLYCVPHIPCALF